MTTMVNCNKASHSFCDARGNPNCKTVRDIDVDVLIRSCLAAGPAAIDYPSSTLSTIFRRVEVIVKQQQLFLTLHYSVTLRSNEESKSSPHAYDLAYRPFIVINLVIKQFSFNQELLRSQPAVHRLSESISICGPIEGQYAGLLNIFQVRVGEYQELFRSYKMARYTDM